MPLCSPAQPGATMNLGQPWPCFHWQAVVRMTLWQFWAWAFRRASSSHFCVLFGNSKAPHARSPATWLQRECGEGNGNMERAMCWVYMEPPRWAQPASCYSCTVPGMSACHHGQSGPGPAECPDDCWCSHLSHRAEGLLKCAQPVQNQRDTMCHFKPLSFGVICHAAINSNWN